MIELLHRTNIKQEGRRDYYWEAKCLIPSCGNLFLVTKSNSKKQKSCGCIKKSGEHIRKIPKNVKGLYLTWSSMKSRCNNPNRSNYKYYGARGVTVCKKWSSSYLDFIKDMGPRPKGFTLERIDNNGNYEPSNCKWSTWKEQSSNKRK